MKFGMIWVFVLLALGGVIIAATFFNRSPLEMPRNESAPYLIEEAMMKNPFSRKLVSYERKDVTVTDSHHVTHAMTYMLQEPMKPYPQGVKFPLVVVLHDSRGYAYAGDMLGTDAMRLKHPSFVMVPQLPRTGSWYVPDDAGLSMYQPARRLLNGTRPLGEAVEQMILQMKDQYPVDMNRVYVVGCEMGGVGAFGIARARPDLIAAVFSINGGWSPQDAASFAQVPIWAMHSRFDEVYTSAFSRDIARALRDRGGDVQYTEFNNDKPDVCQNAGVYASGAIWDWLFRQARKPAAGTGVQKNLASPAKNQVASPP